MFVQVKLLNGFKQSLWYTVEKAEPLPIGSFVEVPLQKRSVLAIVQTIQQTKPNVPFALKAVTSTQPFPQDQYYHQFIQKLAQYYQTDSLSFMRRIQKFIGQKEQVSKHGNDTGKKSRSVNEVMLTNEQQAVVDYINPIVQKPYFAPTVLHGVTGSGKTEVYKKIIQATIAQNKTALLILPEVTLAIQFYNLLSQQLDPSITITSFHSATSTAEKKKVWQKLLKNDPLVIVGVHMPLLIPIANLGCIIIDEEHDPGFQEKKHPKLNSKDIALIRAQMAQIPILLGSATPSIATLHNVKTKGWKFFQLKKRFAGSFPTISMVQLDNKKKRSEFWISTELQQKIANRLSKKEQIIIFINRRGFSFFVQCKQCTFIFECKNCSVSLTLHDNNKLHCHYCDVAQQLAPQCPECDAAQHTFLKKGIGTQHIVKILNNLFPHAHIARADRDSTINKKKWQETITDFQNGNCNILVGTQTITKGYHFPNVTLVGIIWADLNLHIPFYNAAETALQQIIQVAGRAGRQRPGAEVVVQTLADNPIFNFIDEQQYPQFYNREQVIRKLVGYPPYIRLVEIEFKHADEQTVQTEANHFAQSLLNQKITGVKILGPATPPVHKIKNWHIRKIYTKGTNINQMITMFEKTKKRSYKSRIFFTPNPLG